MKDEATPEQLEMARRICASVCGSDAVGRAAAREFLRGDADDESDMRIALAAIIETTELAANIAESEGYQVHGYGAGAHIAKSIRSGRLLKGQDHG